MAKYNSNAPTGYRPYVASVPPSQPDWPVIPIPRDWGGFGDAPSVPAIKRLLRFSTALVNYDSTQPHMSEYSLAEDANNVVVTAPGTPIAGVLLDAYNYFNNTVFQLLDDPNINCRRHIIVYLTDGLDECNSNACAGGPTGKGPSGDLGAVALPERPAGARFAAHLLDPSVPLNGIPVYIVALGLDPTDPTFQCIARNTGGQVFAANDRTTLENALENILDFKTTPLFFSSPAVPAFAGGFSDTAQIGAVVPSHVNEDTSQSIWSIWTGYLKSFRLDTNGDIPVVTAAAPVPTDTPTPGGPTFTPTPLATPTPTPSGGLQYPDESAPNDPSTLARRPVWNAGRVLGYTDPVASLGASAAPTPAIPGAKAPEITVWPGRKLLWATGQNVATPDVPLARFELMPQTAPCVGACFDTLTQTMLNIATAPTLAQYQTARNVVNFLRGGVSTLGSRDEVLNLFPVYTGTPFTLVGPGVGQGQRFSYWFQDDTPAPNTAPPQFRTDGEASPKGYPHKLGDIFHSEAVVIEPPRYFQYLSANLSPNGKPYSDFASLLQFRRKVVMVGANDGFLHAFDSGVWCTLPSNCRDANFPNAFDLGTGREIFGFAVRGTMPLRFPALLQFPPSPQYFVDGSFGTADVFIDASNPHTSPTPANRAWKTVLVGTLRQGGQWLYALDITYPDVIDTTPTDPTFGKVTAGTEDQSPGCLDGAAGCPSAYPQILWELTDDCSVQAARCVAPTAQMMGETWSRPVVGRINTLNSGVNEDRYVAILGGGYDSTFQPLDTVLDADQSPCPPSCKKATRGREFYLVDVETGKIIYKAIGGVDGSGNPQKFAPMTAAPGVVDYNDDGYLDIAYIGDINGQMWRIDLTPDATASPKRGDLVSGMLTGYQPFLLFKTDPTTSPEPVQPIFMEAGIIYIAGGPRPTLGVAFGTGNRAELASDNIRCATAPCPPNSTVPFVNRFYFVVDANQTFTATEDNLRNITPPGGATSAGVGSGPANTGCATTPCTGYFLDFVSQNEKTTSTVFSTQGYLSLITFTPDLNGPCTTDGSSYRYRFFFLNGGRGYNIATPQGNYSDYRQYLGKQLASASQSTSPNGDTIDTVLYSGGAINQQTTAGSLSTVNVNWKEQQ